MGMVWVIALVILAPPFCASARTVISQQQAAAVLQRQVGNVGELLAALNATQVDWVGLTGEHCAPPKSASGGERLDGGGLD